MNVRKGFTLIELLVVIAIIGILSSVVLASLNSARQSSRDARVVSDVKQMQLALELYFDDNGEYPFGTEVTTGTGSFEDLAPSYIAALPTHPVSGEAYQYQAFQTTSGTECDAVGESCLYYHIGAMLEDAGHSALASDVDSELAALTEDSVDGVSATANCASDATAVANSTDRCYDVTP